MSRPPSEKGLAKLLFFVCRPVHGGYIANMLMVIFGAGASFDSSPT